jgi:hypothetical protein
MSRLTARVSRQGCLKAKDSSPYLPSAIHSYIIVAVLYGLLPPLFVLTVVLLFLVTVVVLPADRVVVLVLFVTVVEVRRV